MDIARLKNSWELRGDINFKSRDGYEKFSSQRLLEIL